MKSEIKVIISSSTDEDILEMLDITLFNGITIEQVLVVTHPNQKKLIFPIGVRRINEPKFTNNKITQKIYRLFLFGYLLTTTKAKCIFSNSSLTYKTWQLIFNYTHITYHRALLLDPSHSFGLSEKIRSIFKLKKQNFLNPYHSDIVVTIGECNKSYMLIKGTPPEKIILVGPTWLDKPSTTTETAKKLSNSDKRNVIFITQAFEHHGYTEQQNSQLSFLQSLEKKLSKDNSVTLLIKKHPRDLTDYSRILSEKSKLIKSSSKEFLSSITNTDIIVSPFSTMSLELAFLKAKIIFYSTKSLDKLYSTSYEKYNIRPITDTDLLASIVQENKAFSDIPLEHFFSTIDRTIPFLTQLSKENTRTNTIDP